MKEIQQNGGKNTVQKRTFSGRRDFPEGNTEVGPVAQTAEVKK